MGQSPDGDTINDGERRIPFLQGNADFGDEHPNEMYWCDNPKKLAAPGDILLSEPVPKLIDCALKRTVLEQPQV
ncbi:MAG: hypothetical protein LBP23_07560 [Treponema sp.]|jgi:type I restriction enzyme S subunit|nr:hypothetical protein [Treponema sp.]